MTCSVPLTERSTRKRRSAAARASGSSKRPPRRVRRREQGAQHRRALVGPESVKRRQAAAGEIGTRHVEGTAQRLPPPHRDDLAPGGKRIQPLGRGRKAGTDDRHGARVAVRLIGMDDARVAAQLGRDVEARVPGSQQHVTERPLGVELETRLRRPNRSRLRRRAGSRPSRCAAQLRHVREEVVHRRVVAVEHGGDERTGRAPLSASRNASPGNVVGRQCPSLSERIVRCRIAAACRRQTAAGSASSPKTAISPGSSPPHRNVT